MNSTVQRALARGLASMARDLEPSASPWAYGEDISCGFDLNLGETVSGNDLLRESQIRRLDCPRGGLVDDPDWGIDVRGSLNEGTTREELATLAARVRTELARDPRIATVAVTLATSAYGDRWDLAIRSQPRNPGDTFPLVLALTPESVDEITRGQQ